MEQIWPIDDSLPISVDCQNISQNNFLNVYVIHVDKVALFCWQHSFFQRPSSHLFLGLNPGEPTSPSFNYPHGWAPNSPVLLSDPAHPASADWSRVIMWPNLGQRIGNSYVEGCFPSILVEVLVLNETGGFSIAMVSSTETAETGRASLQRDQMQRGKSRDDRRRKKPDSESCACSFLDFLRELIFPGNKFPFSPQLSGVSLLITTKTNTFYTFLSYLIS